MEEIDYDELDRAVNSTVSSNVTGSSDSDNVTATQPQGQPEPAPTVSVVVNQTASTVPALPSPAMRRSSGRFMDVVHPSSDMRSSTSLTTPEPRKDITTSFQEPAKSPDASGVKTWPDPIDYQPATANSSQEKPVVSESPFLSDAKVEKRPLGAFSSEPSVQASTSTPPDAENSTESSRVDHPIGTDIPMPAELQNNLLSIEGDDSPTTPEVTSITQQYTEKPSTSDQATAAVFNADAYHKPLSHPKKDKSGWLMVLWIFLLLIVGAGTGAAVYFYVLRPL